MAFYESGDYSAIASKRDPRCFLIGRTGGGKSAALQHLEETHRDHVIRINPDDLSLLYITDLQAIRYLDSLNVNLDPLFIALWKHVLLVEIIKHRYKIDTPAAKQSFLTMLRDAIKRDASKQAAVDYLDDFEGKFWCETDERVKEITRRFEEQVKAEAGGRLSAGIAEISGVGGSTSASSSEERVELAERFQRIVNETQLPRLNKMMSVLNENILDSPQNFTYVVIDDLDRDWVDERVVNDLISCLFRTVIDLQRVQHLKVIVALRTNIFEQLNMGSRRGGQEEKFRSLSLDMRWTRADLKEMLNERARVAANEWELDGVNSLADLLPATNKVRGNAFDFVLRRTLMRPRDAIAFLNEALRAASGKQSVTWNELKKAGLPYSEKRLLALRDEWAQSYPGIDKVFEIFQRAPVRLARTQFTDLLESVALLLSDPSFRGQRWLMNLSQALWNGTADPIWAETYQPLTGFLFHIGFIGCSASKAGPAIFAEENLDYAKRADHLREDAQFYVHPAFHLALDVGFS